MLLDHPQHPNFLAFFALLRLFILAGPEDNLHRLMITWAESGTKPLALGCVMLYVLFFYKQHLIFPESVTKLRHSVCPLGHGLAVAGKRSRSCAREGRFPVDSLDWPTIKQTKRRTNRRTNKFRKPHTNKKNLLLEHLVAFPSSQRPLINTVPLKKKEAHLRMPGTQDEQRGRQRSNGSQWFTYRLKKAPLTGFRRHDIQKTTLWSGVAWVLVSLRFKIFMLCFFLWRRNALWLVASPCFAYMDLFEPQTVLSAEHFFPWWLLGITRLEDLHGATLPAERQKTLQPRWASVLGSFRRWYTSYVNCLTIPM